MKGLTPGPHSIWAALRKRCRSVPEQVREEKAGWWEDADDRHRLDRVRAGQEAEACRASAKCPIRDRRKASLSESVNIDWSENEAPFANRI